MRGACLKPAASRRGPPRETCPVLDTGAGTCPTANQSDRYTSEWTSPTSAHAAITLRIPCRK